MLYALMFLVSVLLGLLFALRTQAIINDRPIFATTWTFSSVFVSSLLTNYIIQDQYQIFPIALGQGIGTLIVMKIQYFHQKK
jgi:hypothetical protein